MYVSLLEEGVCDVVVIPALSSTVLLGYVVSPGDKQNASQATHVEDVELLFLHECKVQDSLYIIGSYSRFVYMCSYCMHLLLTCCMLHNGARCGLITI